MRELSFGEEGVFHCYRIDEVEEAKKARDAGKKVMLQRFCSICGDSLFGTSLDPNLKVQCEPGYHNSRPGVWI